MSKHVNVLASFAFGARETWRHLPKLLPLSVLFYAPELLLLADINWFYAWPGVDQVYKVVVFFFLIGVSLKLTAPAASVGHHESPPKPQGRPEDFAMAKAVKWSAMGLGFIFGALPALLWHLHKTGDLPLSWEALKAMPAWIRSLPLWEMLMVLVPMMWLPYRIFVAWNFFGYAIVDRGLGARESLRLARRIAEGAFWPLTLFYSICALLLALGVWAWTVGVVFTFPITLLATVHVYRELAAQTA